MEYSPSLEGVQQVYPLVGGPFDGCSWRGGDGREVIHLPYCGEHAADMSFGLDTEWNETIRSEEYRRGIIKLGSWDTAFVYYRHASIDDEEASLALFGAMWASMLRTAKKHSERLRGVPCRHCDGSGTEYISPP
jgi:hypothetical protein